MPSKSVPPLPGVTPATICVPYSRHVRVWNCPVAPVIPWVTTRVVLSTRMLIARFPLAPSRGRRDGLLRTVGHVRRRDDAETGVGEDLLALLDVGPLHAHDDRHLELDLPGR